LHAFLRLVAQDLVQGGRLLLVSELERVLLLGVGQRVQALRFLRALPVNHQVPRDGEQPGFKFGFAVVLVPALEDADPCLLKKILRAFFVSRDVDEIAEQAVLILLNQPVEQIRVALLQSPRDALPVIAHQRREKESRPRPRRESKKYRPLRREP